MSQGTQELKMGREGEREEGQRISRSGMARKAFQAEGTTSAKVWKCENADQKWT